MNLNQLTLPCRDYEASVRFYRELGFRQIVDAPPRYARFECEAGATFSLHRDDAKDAVGSAVTVYFECEDLDQTVAALKQAGVVFEHEPIDQPWLWREARLLDPAGNRLCLYQAGEMRRFPPWRLQDEHAL